MKGLVLYQIFRILMYNQKIKIMSCSSGKSTKKGRYNKANNLKQPISYTIDSKGNVKPIYSLKTK
jgi:hypothetical protein